MTDNTEYPPKEAFSDLSDLVDRYILDHTRLPVLDPAAVSTNTPIYAQGSCFAQNIANALQDTGMPVARLPLSEQANSLCTNMMLLDYLLHGGDSDYAYQFDELGLYGGARPDTLVGPEYYSEARQNLSNASAIIFTMGNAVGWFDGKDRPFIMNKNYSSKIADKYTYEFDVEENITFLTKIICTIRKINENAPIFFTLSPVPVTKGLYTGSALMDDCVTKSKLRVAISEAETRHILDNEYYWPSFEMFRWVGSHIAQPVFGTADRNARHPSNRMVHLATRKFIERVFPGLKMSSGPRQRASLFTRLRTAYHIVRA